MIWQSAVASSFSEEGGLLLSLQLVVGVYTTADIQPALPLGAVSVVNDGFGCFVGHRVAELLHSAASLGYRINCLMSSSSTVGQQTSIYVINLVSVGGEIPISRGMENLHENRTAAG